VLADSLAQIKNEGVVIVDSAGRDTIDDELVREIKEVRSILQPDEKWLVLSGDIGQKAGEIAKQFNEYVGLTGVIITKLEGTAKGGGALSAVAQVKQPVIFIGVGEKIEDLEEFDPNRFLQRILGFGDIKALMEKVQEVAEEEEMNPEELLREEYTLRTFYKQLKAQKKMGPLKNIFQMLGMPVNIPEEVLKTGEERLKKFKFMMDSMTPQELENPDIITHERIERISKGSGTKESEVKQLLSDFGKSKKLVNMFKKGKMPRQLRRMMGSMKE
jgi:signal recognition particle subunit SRP54